MKTAMQQLKDKIQVVIGEMNGELSLYESGYKQCLINIQNDIDIQMMAMEKEQIERANECGFKDGNLYANGEQWAFESPEQYYEQTYGGNK